MCVTTVRQYYFNNDMVLPRAIDCKKKQDSSVCQVSYCSTFLFVSVRRLCLIDNEIIGIQDDFQKTEENIFAHIGEMTVSDATLRNKSSLINDYIYKVKKVSVSNCIVAFPAKFIVKKCIHIPIKHSENDFIVLKPNTYERH